MPTFLDLLYDEAPLAAFDEHLAQCEADLGEADAAVVRSEYDVAVRLRDLMGRMRSREAELSALYETASDLTAIRDVDTILAAIVRRARQLLHCDMTYLSLNDEGDGASYMKVTDGALTREFQTLRLPLGTGLLGLVAQTGAAYFTEDYASDERFVHQGYIDEAVAGEQIRAILGVPLVLDGVVIGALLAVHRSVRRFPQSEVSLLTSFAAHAVVALENARLFAELDEANRSLTRHTEAVDAAALAHDRLTDLLIGGGGVAEVAEVLSGVLHGAVSVWTPTGELLAGDDAPQARPDAVPEAVAEAVTSGRSVATGSGLVAAALARTEHVATLVLRRDEPLDLAGSSYARARSAGHRAGPALRPLRHRRRGAPRRPAPRRPAGVRPRLARAVARPRTTPQRQPRRPRGGRRRHGRRRRPAPREPRRRGPRAAQLRPRRRAPRRGGRGGAERGPPPRGGRPAGGRGRARGSGDRRRRRHERRAPR